MRSGMMVLGALMTAGMALAGTGGESPSVARAGIVAPAAPAALLVAIGELERGNRHFRAGRYREAVEAYQGALEDGEDSAVLRYNLGTALLRLGRYAEAEEHLKAALEVVEPETR
ncbi:MAG TPA: tetratricopeptide repeat protein, partial [Longimicrobiales bacterium]|nr:tetratricopeptide repeat protein [Longimicrobiales bacterium]